MNLWKIAVCLIFTVPALVLADTDPSTPADQATQPSQVKELAGLIMVDAALQVNRGLTGGTYFELVEISTPSTPAANHARLFLTPGTGSKQQLSIIFDDGTAVRITGN